MWEERERGRKWDELELIGRERKREEQDGRRNGERGIEEGRITRG